MRKIYNSWYCKLLEAQVVQKNLFEDDLLQEEQKNQVLNNDSLLQKLQPQEDMNVNDFQEQEIPTVEEDNIAQYMVDNNESDSLVPTEEQPDIVEPAPLEMTKEETPEFGNTQDAINWAIQNNKVVRINYTTKKGIDVTRIVEPHAIISAKTGNQILVTYDRSVRKIRAFVINNIMNYIFTGKKFKPRIRVLPKKGKIAMKNIFNQLHDIGNKLEVKGLNKSAAIINDVMQNLINVKTAQYEGGQGYAIRNQRCWSNCYRNKRTTSPEKTAHAVWTECWEEYNKAIDTDNTKSWDKYASTNTDSSIGEYESTATVKDASNNFRKTVQSSINDGIDIPNAVYAQIDKDMEKLSNDIIENSDILISLAEILTEKGHKEIGKRLAAISVNLLKEADFGNQYWGSQNGIGNSVVGRGAKKVWDFMSGNREGGKNEQKFVTTRLKNILTRINQILQMIQFGSRFADSQESLTKTAQAVNPPPAPVAPTAPAVAPSSKKGRAKQQATPQQQQKMNGIVTEFGKFMKDLGQEIAVLSGIASKSNIPMLPVVIQSITKFQNEAQQSFQAKKGFNLKFLLPNLNALRTEIVNGMANIQNAPAQEETSAEPQQEQQQQQAQQVQQQAQQPQMLDLNNIENYTDISGIDAAIIRLQKRKQDLQNG